MPDEAFTRRRILVGLDASPASLDALEAAAALADRIGAELEALFVEDEELLRFASLPFAEIVRRSGAPGGRLERGTAEAIFRAIAARARAAVERATSRGVACQLRVVQGRVVDEVLTAAERADLLVLGAGGHARSGPAAVGDTARAAATRARPPVLLLAPGARLDERVVAVDDGSPAGAHAVEIARKLGLAGRATVVRATRGAALGPGLRPAPALVVLPASCSTARGGALDELLALGMAVLVVR